MVFIEQRGVPGGPDVVMLHGMPSAPDTMWHVGEALLDIAHVSNVHLPGYGKSAPLRPYDTVGALDAVEQALATAGVRSPLLVGYSGGVWRALALALRPSMGARAVVSLAGLHAVGPAHRESLRGAAAAARDRSKDLAALFTPAFLGPLGLANPAFVAEVRGWFACVDREDLAAELEDFVMQPALDLSGLGVPVLARVGDADQACPVALTDALLAALPKATPSTRQVVPGVAHALMLEDERGTAAAVRDFVLSLG